MTLTDAFGNQLRLDDEVYFAGTDHNRKPTLNRGLIDSLNIPNREVRVVRNARSGIGVADNERRSVWVPCTKVGLVNP
jgi:hypothetical protein